MEELYIKVCRESDRRQKERLENPWEEYPAILDLFHRMQKRGEPCEIVATWDEIYNRHKEDKPILAEAVLHGVGLILNQDDDKKGIKEFTDLELTLENRGYGLRIFAKLAQEIIGEPETYTDAQRRHIACDCLGLSLENIKAIVEFWRYFQSPPNGAKFVVNPWEMVRGNQATTEDTGNDQDELPGIPPENNEVKYFWHKGEWPSLP